jgi:hypothetical protein
MMNQRIVRRKREKGHMLRLDFAPRIRKDEKETIRQILSQGLTDSQKILHDQSRVKSFYRVETPYRPIFVKARFFPSLIRRFGRTLRKTKEEREFRNYLSLKDQSVPCPEPICFGRGYRGPFVEKSLLVLEYLPDALPLRHFMSQPGRSVESLLDELVGFLGLLRDKGVIHDDLQWDNILATPEQTGHHFYLVDALHIRWSPVSERDTFPNTIAWFMHYMTKEGVPEEIREALLARLDRAGLPREIGH